MKEPLNIPNVVKVVNGLVDNTMTDEEKELVTEIVEHYIDVFYDPDMDEFDEVGFKENIDYIDVRIKHLTSVKNVYDDVFYG